MKQMLRVAAAAALAAAAAAAPTPLAPDQTLDRRAVGEIAMSSGGSSVAFTVPNPEGRFAPAKYLAGRSRQRTRASVHLLAEERLFSAMVA